MVLATNLPLLILDREEGIEMIKDEEGLEQSVENAILIGVPEEEAKRLLKGCNEKVLSGEWVELKTLSVGSTTNPEVYPQATSLCRYWGKEKYKLCSGKQLYKLYNQGIIGKTHEMIRGSDKYKPISVLSDGEVSIPFIRRVLHRHWEIGRMHKRENGKYKAPDK